jgi:hypothetical protein
MDLDLDVVGADQKATARRERVDLEGRRTSPELASFRLDRELGHGG